MRKYWTSIIQHQDVIRNDKFHISEAYKRIRDDNVKWCIYSKKFLKIPIK